MTPTAYVAEDGLVGHLWKEKPFVQSRFDSQFKGMSRCSKGAYRSRLVGLFRDLMVRNLGKEITYEL